MIALRIDASEAECLALVQSGGPWYAQRGWIACANIGQALAVRAAHVVVEEQDKPPLLLTSEERRRETLFVSVCEADGRVG